MKNIDKMAIEFAQKIDPLNLTPEKQADIMMGYIQGFKDAATLYNPYASKAVTSLRNGIYPLSINIKNLSDSIQPCTLFSNKISNDNLKITAPTLKTGTSDNEYKTLLSTIFTNPVRLNGYKLETWYTNQLSQKWDILSGDGIAIADYNPTEGWPERGMHPLYAESLDFTFLVNDKCHIKFDVNPNENIQLFFHYSLELLNTKE